MIAFLRAHDLFFFLLALWVLVFHRTDYLQPCSSDPATSLLVHHVRRWVQRWSVEEAGCLDMLVQCLHILFDLLLHWRGNWVALFLEKALVSLKSVSNDERHMRGGIPIDRLLLRGLCNRVYLCLELFLSRQLVELNAWWIGLLVRLKRMVRRDHNLNSFFSFLILLLENSTASLKP